MPFTVIREGGGRHADLREVLLGSVPVDNPFRIGDVGGDLPYGKCPGGGSTNWWRNGSWVNPPGENLAELEPPFAGERNDNGGDGGTGDLH